MRNRFVFVILLFALAVTGCSASKETQTKKQSEPSKTAVAGSGASKAPETTGTHQMLGLTIPRGFDINVFASGLSSPRLMALSPDKRIFVADMGAGRVVILPDENHDGKADRTIVYLSGLVRPNSIAFHNGYIYVAQADKITRYKYRAGDDKALDGQAIITGLPTSGHFTKTIVFGPDGKLYLSMGSSCNVCIESNPQRGAITQYNPNGTGKLIYATGLRNAVGLAFQPGTGKLFATVNGRDYLGDNIPPDEIVIVRKGGFYGWPYAYDDKVPDPQFGSRNPAKVREMIPPTLAIQAHSAPLGLAFYTGNQFPASYRGDLFVALHGSWNRTVPVGYKVVLVSVRDSKLGTPRNFVTGFLKSNGRKIGRPVGVLVGPRGALYISDDYAGRVYRVSYSK